MKYFINYSIQLVLFIILGAAYAQFMTHFTPLYFFSENVRHVLLLIVASILSLASVHLIKNVFGFVTK